MELMHYLGLLRRWAWLLILGLVLGASAGLFWGLRQPRIYSTTTKLMVGGSQQTGTQLDYMNSYNAQQLALTYLELLKTRPLLDSVSKRVGYPVSSVSAQLLPNTQIIQIQVQDTDPVHAMEIANAVGIVLIEQNETLQAGRFASTEANLQAQADQIQKQISTLQGNITTISQQSIQQQLDQVKSQIAPLQDQATKLEQQISVLQAENDSYIFPSDDQKNKIAHNKALIIEKQNSIAQIKPLLDQYQQVYSNLLVMGQSSSTSGQDNIQVKQFQSTLAVYQQLYINLLSNLETVRLSRMQSTPTVTQIEPATLPQSPISPRPMNNAASTGAVGLLLAAGVVFLVEYLDDTIKTPEQVEQILGLTVLGYIADVPVAKNPDHGLYVSSQPRSPVAEAFRSLRTNLEYTGIDHPLRTLLVTSAGPGEGKSTVAANLAAIVAQSGKHVVLMDTDLRRPSVHRFFDIANREGLTDVFRDHLGLDAVNHPWDWDSNISIITSGSLPPNPTELLGSDRMTQILDSLKKQKDFIILDAPPSIVADPQVLASKVDGVVIVAWPGHTQLSGLRVTMEQLNRVGANVVGIIFNRIPHNREGYYGGYKHYSRYYYSKYQSYVDDTVPTAASETK
jgi:polysaccharide biosynthesis transport protein